MISDVLVFCPVLRLEPATVRALVGLEWGGPLSVLLQKDNPRQRDSRQERAGMTAAAVREDQWADHLWQYQRGRDLFLEGGFDALLVIESDIVPPADTLQRLAALLDGGADLAYGVYLFRGGDAVNILERYYWDRPLVKGKRKAARNIGESLTMRPGLYAAACERGVIECSGSGLGCVLIKRHVIEAVPFEAPKDPGFFDWAWTQAVYSAGYLMQADMGIKCGHITAEGRELWPD